MTEFEKQSGFTAEQAGSIADGVIQKHASKWRAARSIGPVNNEQPGIEWYRHGVAALGEPPTVCRIEYYANEAERDAMLFKSPNFAK